jgi:hypothetical protein
MGAVAVKKLTAASLETHWWDRDLGHGMMTLRMFDELWRNGYRVMYREDLT